MNAPTGNRTHRLEIRGPAAARKIVSMLKAAVINLSTLTRASADA
jgi:hypothetical protein